MSATSSHVFTPDATAGSPASDDNPISRWMTQLEALIRRFPQKSVLISFLIGALLRFTIIRALLINLVRLILWLGGPALISFAAWRLYVLIKEPKTSPLARSDLTAAEL
jgi:hypothetical protein